MDVDSFTQAEGMSTKYPKRSLIKKEKSTWNSLWCLLVSPCSSLSSIRRKPKQTVSEDKWAGSKNYDNTAP